MVSGFQGFVRVCFVTILEYGVYPPCLRASALRNTGTHAPPKSGVRTRTTPSLTGAGCRMWDLELRV
jgi:hypothetical protein